MISQPAWTHTLRSRINRGRRVITNLRNNHPSWTWVFDQGTSRDHGAFIGTLGARTVRVFAVAIILDGSNHVTDWRVDTGTEVISYSQWYQANHG